jgi:chitin disaccharide deacetylase
MSPHRLIIHADDFGFTHGITEGIVQAFQEGVLTSTSAMINISGAPERIARARNQEPRFAVGLHLNITTGKPVLPPERVPTLVDRQGCFYSMVQLIERLPSISLSELNAEIRAQVALLKESSGPFDHIDYHQMVLSLYQPFYPLVINLARDYGVPVRQPAFSRFARIKLPKPAGASQAAIKMLLGTLLRRPLLMIRLMPAVSPAGSNLLPVSLKAAGVSTTDWFIASFFDCPYLENFLAILEQLPEGTSELMCHVGRVDDDLLSGGDTYIYQRARELEILPDPRVCETIQRIGIELVDFSAVQNT